MAAGDYSEHLPAPSEPSEAELAATEQKRTRLVSDLAHELRSPQATIEGYMEGLIDGVLPAEASTYETGKGLDSSSDGTGKGLHIARALARAHDGEITALSEGAEKGSTFALQVPAH